MTFMSSHPFKSTRVEDLPELWTGYEEMTAVERKQLLRETIKNLTAFQNPSEQTLTILNRSFRDDAAVLAKFHQDVLGDEAKRYPIWTTTGAPTNNSAILALVRIPSNLGASLDSPRAVEWAADMLPRFLATQTREVGGGFHWHADRMLRVSKKLFKSGIPLSYVNAFHPSTFGRREYPAKEVIAAYRDGIAAEYLHVMLEDD